MSATQDQKGADFRELHEGEPFIAPNPWDAGSARVLEALGFKALATTSSGFAYTLGRLDGAASLDEVLDHVRSIDAATRSSPRALSAPASEAGWRGSASQRSRPRRCATPAASHRCPPRSRSRSG